MGSVEGSDSEDEEFYDPDIYDEVKYANYVLLSLLLVSSLSPLIAPN